MINIWLTLLPVILQVSCALPANLHNGNAHNRTLREQECYEDEYWHQGYCCRTCPTGTRVSAHCTAHHTRGVCKACTRGEDFTAFPSGMEKCVSCLECKNDKVSVHECTPEANAVCECKPGTYCSPGEPCEICSRCSRCGDGQQIKNECTPTTDTVCEDISLPTSTQANVNDKSTVLKPNDSLNDVPKERTRPTKPPDTQAGSQLYLYLILAVVALLLIIFIILGYRYYKRRADDNNIKNSLLGITQNSGNSSLDSVHTEEKEEELPPEHQPLVTPEPWKIEQQIYQTAAPCLVGAQREPVENQVTESPGRDVEGEEGPQVGAPCEVCCTQQSEHHWTDFFYIVINNVDQKHMTQLVRKLHLPRNTIAQISNDYPNDCIERSFKFLEKWKEQNGKKASMRDVFKVLNDMDLAGCCENIVNDLKTKKIPIN